MDDDTADAGTADELLALGAVAPLPLELVVAAWATAALGEDLEAVAAAPCKPFITAITVRFSTGQTGTLLLGLTVELLTPATFTASFDSLANGAEAEGPVGAGGALLEPACLG